jgi:hypothetical protein
MIKLTSQIRDSHFASMRFFRIVAAAVDKHSGSRCPILLDKKSITVLFFAPVCKAKGCGSCRRTPISPLIPVNSRKANPAIRTAGRRARATRRLTAQAIDGALEGDPHLLRLCISRLLPTPRGRRVQLDLPAGDSLTEIAAALAATVRAVAEGVISPLEATDLAEVIEAQRRLVETVALQRRVVALEEASREVVAVGRRLWQAPREGAPLTSEADFDAPFGTPPEISFGWDDQG